MPKQITPPEPVKLRDPISKTYFAQPAFRFEHYLEMAVFQNPKLDNPKGWRWAAKIVTLVSQNTNQATGITGPFVLTDEDWKLLADCDADPEYVELDDNGQKSAGKGFRGISASIARQLLPFSDCIQEATSTE